MRASSSRVACDMLISSSRYDPAVGVSRQPIRCMSVDLPDPDVPVMATYSPAPMEHETPLSACTSVWPMVYFFTKSLTSMRFIALSTYSASASKSTLKDCIFLFESFYVYNHVRSGVNAIAYLCKLSVIDPKINVNLFDCILIF